MSVSFMWEELKPDRARSFGAGTSFDCAALEETFGQTVSTDDLGILKAMHRATRLDKSLWSEIADALERLRGDDYDRRVTIKIWTQY